MEQRNKTKAKKKMTLTQKRLWILSITSLVASFCLSGMIVAILAVVGVI